MRKLRMHELNRLSIEEFRQSEKHPIVVVLDNVRSVLNVGSVFRTCDAFKIEHLWLCGVTPTPELREMRKTALGGTESVNWTYTKDTMEVILRLKKEGYSIAGVEQTTGSISLEKTTFDKKPTALVFGNEVKGVQSEILPYCDQLIEIPQFGTKHSLNISVSAGIVLWKAVEPYLRK
ncbi:MAG TPA: RNA methyltransferase [Cryomorphaceae bacterium]|nr:RNA methyltransferase [Owenweeksia sp.]MBF98433.1 RNA methyltransferase [Owenweeksia sp.]HAD97658.1 RNA methyltransferase [Cryomorphaceae bacterium]HBF20993.1 RNA methyltransferase [Cryomorphaceae bacterium]HCQ17499.1 RNA methyltransferase [Cryomorphaceae bacterium]|tara:strand:+ start:2682 stop:3212 length:531 start_codon:yes stop_codon:yes gene_type:complete